MVQIQQHTIENVPQVAIRITCFSLFVNTESKKEKEPEAELVEDVLQIMNIFVAKMNGLRKYSVKS